MSFLVALRAALIAVFLPRRAASFVGALEALRQSRRRTAARSAHCEPSPSLKVKKRVG
jgi:hypothetical protein